MKYRHNKYKKKSNSQWTKSKGKVKELFIENITANDIHVGCWRLDTPYGKLDGYDLHKLWASGSGNIVRHLCSDSRCFNPIHLIKGTEFDNADDELELRDYVIEYMKSDLNVCDLINEPKDRAFLVLLPRFSAKYRFNSLRLANRYIRNNYRLYAIECMKRLIMRNDPDIYDRIDVAKELMSRLIERDDIIITVVDEIGDGNEKV